MALCELGHRVMSWGQCCSLQELPPEPVFAPWDPRSALEPMRAFRYVYGTCDEVEAASQKKEHTPCP